MEEYYIYEHEKLNGFERQVLRIEQLPKEQQCLHGQLWRVHNELKIHRSLLDWIEHEMSSVVAEIESVKQDGKSQYGHKKEKTWLTLPNCRCQKQIQGPRRKCLRPISPAALSSVHASNVWKPI